MGERKILFADEIVSYSNVDTLYMLYIFRYVLITYYTLAQLYDWNKIRLSVHLENIIVRLSKVKSVNIRTM